MSTPVLSGVPYDVSMTVVINRCIALNTGRDCCSYRDHVPCVNQALWLRMQGAEPPIPCVFMMYRRIHLDRLHKQIHKL